MNPSLKPRIVIIAKNTIINKSCGISPDFARGYICKADLYGVSVYIEPK